MLLSSSTALTPPTLSGPGLLQGLRQDDLLAAQDTRGPDLGSASQTHPLELYPGSGDVVGDEQVLMPRVCGVGGVHVPTMTASADRCCDSGCLRLSTNTTDHLRSRRRN